MTDSHWQQLSAKLDEVAALGRQVDFWWRDDDAAEPTAALDRLLSLVGEYAVPVVIAVPPAQATDALSRRLEGLSGASVAVHGWAHRNHAPPLEKKQELGGHRPRATVLQELERGYARLQMLFPAGFVPMLVPPWNRIDAALLDGLPDIGFTALSVFGPEKPSPLSVVNTHVDVMDWRGTRGCRDHALIIADIMTRLRQVCGDEEERADQTGRTIGLLTHHLVHDDGVWDFLEGLFALTVRHPACRWLSGRQVTDR
ncbi:MULTISPECIES: polysaccharide deacetylase family protein [unclassified Ensifer]|uniref:polysaccharide deacetylase family protein n=1 Tax=unclassified Ensifer TaxID=2633371 RepID=UPI000813A50E|nr:MULTISPECIES: polysaccharide deacetylase family protein [unclassified Ensifer]OCO99210.1 polysaccharide deacetylase [Ensifer sp. LC11]OCO99417.1 polysaccharide deacetylase [Ensifer sp. LC13]OCP12835.1 polysaccharide deacetylase [Ensifer sp. LC14]OCP29545.1 polysaccharide deacetylase [Ensifer sp. LC499]